MGYDCIAAGVGWFGTLIEARDRRIAKSISSGIVAFFLTAFALGMASFTTTYGWLMVSIGIVAGVLWAVTGAYWDKI
jgi:energy-converting hydrogenase Eha subunit A